MKRIIYLLVVLSVFAACGKKEKESASAFYVPGLDTIYNKIVKNYGEKGRFCSATNSYAYFKGNSIRPYFNVFYYPDRKEINLSIYDELPNGEIYAQSAILTEGSEKISEEVISFAKYVEGKKFVPIKATQEKVEMLLNSF